MSPVGDFNGETEHGVTWHLLDKQLDVGDIVQQKRFAIDDDESAFSLNAKCFEYGFTSFCDLLVCPAGWSSRSRRTFPAESTFQKPNDPMREA